MSKLFKVAILATCAVGLYVVGKRAKEAVRESYLDNAIADLNAQLYAAKDSDGPTLGLRVTYETVAAIYSEFHKGADFATYYKTKYAAHYNTYQDIIKVK